MPTGDQIVSTIILVVVALLVWRSFLGLGRRRAKRAEDAARQVTENRFKDGETDDKDPGGPV